MLSKAVSLFLIVLRFMIFYIFDDLSNSSVYVDLFLTSIT